MKKFFLLIIASALSLQLQAQQQLQKPIVYIFLSETCPICQSYTVILDSLYEKYKMNIRFIGIFPDSFSSDDSIAAFAKKFRVAFPLQRDENGTVTKRLQATVTPEVFVEGSSGVIVYSGRIDNTFFKVGGRRNITTTSELADALAALAKGKSIPVKHTTAIGCVIMNN